ncbi:nitroreductase [Sneathiella sp.]|jgi:nitroreductase|uniref:nitroreductase n=1 Tax=Sneathiella sp. TaxID=1964365 RepID=UPI0039E6CBC9
MDFDTVVRERRSTRGFKPDPIPKKILNEIIELAARAPSSMNTQPWHLHVISGAPLDRIRAGNTEKTLAGVPPSREFRVEGKYEGVHRQRQVDIAVQLFEAMGIERDDKERRQEWVLRGFRQFDAPVSVIVAYDKELQGDIRHFDLGAITYGLVLAAWSRGIGAVINSQGIMQSPVVREHANIPDNHVIQTAVAMGYPDDSFAANAVVSTRRPTEEIATFVGFDD